MSNATLLGTTTLWQMVSAVYNKKDPLYSRHLHSKLGILVYLGEELDASDAIVYVCHHHIEEQTVMTTIKGDIRGLADKSACFKGKVDMSDLIEQPLA